MYSVKFPMPRLKLKLNYLMGNPSPSTKTLDTWDEQTFGDHDFSKTI
jgi:hypothetical protein